MVDDQSLATLGISRLVIETLPFQEIPFSHHRAVVYTWECWNKFLVVGCRSSHQPTYATEIKSMGIA